MPRQSYNLPRLTAFADKVSNTTHEYASRGDTNSPPSTAHINDAEVISTELFPPSIPSESAINGERDWIDGLCNCCHDKSHCALTTFFPCCMTCHEYEIHGEGCGTPLCLCMSLLPLTTKYRTKHRIRGTMRKDCLLSIFCWQCHLCRLHRDFMATKGDSDSDREEQTAEAAKKDGPFKTGVVDAPILDSANAD
ncbi:placenta specific locus tag 8 protein [Echinococcus multilocularis]|uniref:Placenta specific locus tag 8 protein n=1 Tax=Echinococcus multilocularis TaxID=6211 RepID=A0A068Y8D5_ECHMU|nr:placenta specific locus tag 8 protein [Echinococcus multilocularis]